jgi:hypothetical protein
MGPHTGQASFKAGAREGRVEGTKQGSDLGHVGGLPQLARHTELVDDVASLGGREEEHARL